MAKFGRAFTLIDRIADRFVPPEMSRDDYTVRALAGLSVIGFVLVLAYAALWLVILPERPERIVFPLLALLPTGIPLILLRQRRTNLARHIFLVGIWIIITFTIFTAGGTRAPLWGAYVLVVIMAAFLSGWTAAFVYMSLSLALGFIMALLDPAGTSTVPFATPMSAWLTQSLTLLMVCGVVYYMLRRNQTALRRVQVALAEREQMQQSLIDSEERFRLIAAVTSDYTFSSALNAEGELEHRLLTGAFEAITGYTPEEFTQIGGWRATLHPDDLEQDARDLAALRQNQRVTTEVRIVKKSGEVRWVRVDAHPVWDDTLKRLVRIDGGVRDITDRKRAEEQIRESEQSLRQLTDAAVDGIAMTQDGRIILANQRLAEMLGYKPAEIIGMPVATFVASQDRELVQGHMHSGDESMYEHLALRRDGSQFPVEIHGKLMSYHGTTVRVASIRDITARKQVEAQLRAGEERLRLALEAARMGTWDWNVVTGAVTWSDQVEPIFGLEKGTFDGTYKSYTNLIYQEDRAEMEQAIADVLAGHLEDYVIQHRVEVPGEDLRWVEGRGRLYYDETGKPVRMAGIVTDITARKRLEAELHMYAHQLENLVDERTNALRRAKEQLELILNTTADALAFAHPNGDILMTNPAFLDIFGESAARSIEGVLAALPDDRQVEAIGAALLGVIHNGERHRLEAQVVSQGGGEMDIDLTLLPVQTVESDSRNGVLFSGHDITQFKEIERFKARFVADAVHDLATPISGLSTRLYLLAHSPEKLADHVRALENQVLHLRNLLDDLRTLSRMDREQLALKMELCNVNELVQRVFDTYEPVAIDKRQSLVLRVDPTLPDALLDPREIERVLVNLVSNAVNYSPEHKEICIETGVEDRRVVIRVADQGMGIPPDELPLIFGRFYRSAEARRSVSSGTGLGLAIAKEILELHGGSIAVTSEPGQGSTFTASLPLPA